MNGHRVAIIFDNTLRQETTGLYCRRALGQLVEIEHLLPTDLGRIKAGEFGAFIYIDDGLAYNPAPHLRPSVWWAIDTHLDYDRCLRKARLCDLVFAAQRDGAEQLQRDGVSATWLPLACDPDLHRPHNSTEEFDWCFVGHLFPGPRTELIERLMSQFPRAFVGQRYFEDMARTYSASRLVFNRSVRNDVNMRVFEALACGSLLISNDLAENGQAELFQDGVHLTTYSTLDELFDRMRFYLTHDVERERIAAQGRAAVLAKHTYRHRMEIILSALGAQSISAASRQPQTNVPLKDVTYFEWDRPDVLALIPTTARRVLDLGCGGGRLGQTLKERQPAEVWGVERDPQAAAHAAQRLDHVITGDLDSESWSLPTAGMDVIVCADVLEHLRHPERVLQRCRAWLASGGCLIASLPNVQHHSVASGLLEGNFTYEPAGLLDEDHLRLFTRREIDKLFFRAGYRIVEWRAVPGEGYAEWDAADRPGEVRIGGLQISGLDSIRAEAFFTYQYLVRAEPIPVPDDGVTSIILVTYNQLNYTRQCIESLRFRTEEPFELIVVDNGSMDGTVDYFRAQPDVTLVTNRENRGFPAAVNQGLQLATGCQILLLNNDTILTTGWLRRLLNALHSDSKIGLVGPVSNSVSGLQQIPVDYHHLASLDGFAWEWGCKHAEQRVDLDRLVGFCLLIRREVIDLIGVLDERFGTGNFEDDDYCRRAQQAGYRTVVAVDSFVHHFGSRTFVASGIDFAALLKENEQKYREKWDTAPAGTGEDSQSPSFAIAEAPGGGLLLAPFKPQLSLCMIVRNNETTIRPCLESIRPWVDEMIVVDTGSTDATPQICAELGAKVSHWPWRDDFSAARNESLQHATGEWLFWMDSDDTMPEECGHRLRALVDGQHARDVLGYVIQVHCPSPNGDGLHDVTAVDHVKLFRNRSDLRFEHRIHEQILPAIRRANGEVAFTDIHVVHSGADHTPDGRQRKLERDFKLLQLDLAERPDHPFVLFNLGMTHADCRQLDEAIHWLARCLEVSPPDQSHVCKTYALLVSSLMQLGELERALAVCQRGRGLFPGDKELLFRQAMLAHELGNLDEAATLYRDVLAPSNERHFVSVDVGLVGYKARHNLAIVYEHQARTDLAEQEWRAILAEQPQYLPAQIGLVDCLLQRGVFEEAIPRIESLRRHPDTAADGFRLAARLLEAQQDASAAIGELQRGLQEFVEDPGLLRELARLLHANEDYPTALGTLERLTSLVPDDAAAWHNRGVVLALLNRHDDAQQAFAKASALRMPSTRSPLTIHRGGST